AVDLCYIRHVTGADRLIDDIENAVAEAAEVIHGGADKFKGKIVLGGLDAIEFEHAFADVDHSHARPSGGKENSGQSATGRETQDACVFDIAAQPIFGVERAQRIFEVLRFGGGSVAFAETGTFVPGLAVLSVNI